ncbi:MAG: hypothetical protein ABI651_15685 [Verrucomicrobiota bacterium]
MTLRSVAYFATASFKRLLIAQSVVACFVALSIWWSLQIGWVPRLEEAISHLPDRGEIRDGKLEWQADSPMLLTESPLVRVEIDLEGTAGINEMADFGFTLKRKALRVRSLFGFREMPYSSHWVMPLNRDDLEPWWGARKPFILISVAILVVALLLFSWAVLATLYSWPVYLLAFYLDRTATWWNCWKLAAAALLPGALVMTGALWLYSMQRLNLIAFLITVPIQLLMGWIYASWAPRCLPSLSPDSTPNPFGKPARPGDADSDSGRANNPFAPPPLA